MTDHRARLVLAACLLALPAVFVAWAWWPESSGSADLVDAPAPNTSSPPSTTTRSPEHQHHDHQHQHPTPAPPVGAPLRLQIPAIGVDAPIVPVGLRSDGAMEVPPAAEVGWYRLGPRPGEPGSAVLAGHIDFDGRPGAFFELLSIPPGAEIIVTGDLSSRRYVVTAREQIPKAEVDLARYFTRRRSRADHAHHLWRRLRPERRSLSRQHHRLSSTGRRP